MATKICVICGAQFKASPSDKKVTCSPACRSVRASLAAKSSRRNWSEDAKRRRSDDPSVQQRMVDLQPIGTSAAMAKPEGQRGPQNRASKIWILVDPNGDRHTAVNLLDWSREHYNIFEPDSKDIDVTAQRIAKGFGAIASSMRGVKSRQRQVCQYKGWRLDGLPVDR